MGLVDRGKPDLSEREKLRRFKRGSPAPAAESGSAPPTAAVSTGATPALTRT